MRPRNLVSVFQGDAAAEAIGASFSLFTIAFLFWFICISAGKHPILFAEVSPEFRGKPQWGLLGKQAAPSQQCPKKRLCALVRAGRAGSFDVEGTRHSGGIWAEFAAVRTTPDSAKKAGMSSVVFGRHVCSSYSFFARGRASSFRTRRSICFSMAVRRSSGRLMDGCRVKRKPIRRRSWLRCFVPMTSRQIAS